MTGFGGHWPGKVRGVSTSYVASYNWAFSKRASNPAVNLISFHPLLNSNNTPHQLFPNLGQNSRANKRTINRGGSLRGSLFTRLLQILPDPKHHQFSSSPLSLSLSIHISLSLYKLLKFSLKDQNPNFRNRNRIKDPSIRNFSRASKQPLVFFFLGLNFPGKFLLRSALNLPLVCEKVRSSFCLPILSTSNL